MTAQIVYFFHRRRPHNPLLISNIFLQTLVTKMFAKVFATLTLEMTHIPYPVPYLKENQPAIQLFIRIFRFEGHCSSPDYNHHRSAASRRSSGSARGGGGRVFLDFSGFPPKFSDLLGREPGDPSSLRVHPIFFAWTAKSRFCVEAEFSLELYVPVCSS